jgi:hypothetical protein
VAEDGGDMQLLVLDANGNAAPLLQVDGQSKSEITGPALKRRSTYSAGLADEGRYVASESTMYRF